MRQTIGTLIIITLLFYVGCGQPNENGALSVTKTERHLVNDIGIASFTTPEGWTPNRSDGNTAAILTRNGANPTALEEMISIDVGKPTSPDVKGSADGLAKKFGGTVFELPYAVDGADAYRVSIPPNYESMLPRECIVVHHNQKVCFLFGGSKSRSNIWPTVDEIARSWNWN